MFIKNKKIILILIIIISALIFFFNFNKKKAEVSPEVYEEKIIKSSNLLENVKYTANDAKGNTYEINAEIGEIDINNSNIIFLTNITAIIKLSDSKIININSKFGKYNTANFDTIFSKDVTINYLNNEISGEYLDFSIKRDSMIISRNVVYNNLENILKADVIEINISNKDTKVFMFKDNKKVNIKSKE